MAIIHTTRANTGNGHTQLRTFSALASGARTMRPAPNRPMNAAGTAAHRCGWSVQSVESNASNTQPSAKPSSTTPGMTCSCDPPNGPDGQHNRGQQPAQRGGGNAQANVALPPV